MAKQKCNIYEAKKILGINRGKSYATITRDKKGENTRQNQMKEEETNATKTEAEEGAI